jgi:hypothetical protein
MAGDGADWRTVDAALLKLTVSWLLDFDSSSPAISAPTIVYNNNNNNNNNDNDNNDDNNNNNNNNNNKLLK